MCLVLALAVYFKPEFFSYNCFQSSPSKKKGLQYSNSVVSMVSNAAVSLSEATKNASHTKMPFINEVRYHLFFPVGFYIYICSLCNLSYL